jgi:signal transduction histidine kinase
VWLVVFLQQTAIWSSSGPLGAWAASLTLAVALVLMNADGQFPRAALRALQGPRPQASSTRLHSQYQRQIREAAAQEERHRLARDLHDAIKQQIFVIHTAAATAQERFDGDPAGARTAIEQIRTSARDAMTEMEVMLNQLRAEPLENSSLVDALKKQCEALGFRTGARVDFQLGTLPPSDALIPGTQRAMLRIAQEALSNVARHARASQVIVSLGATDRGPLELVIRDDGAGFDPERPSNGMGTTSMRTRAEECAGVFQLVSQPGRGTTVKLAVPHLIDASGQYRFMMCVWAALLAAAIGLLWWGHVTTGSAITAIAALGLVRNTVAYWRR